LLASHKLNELNGTSSKHRKQLRLYELREFSAVCGLNPSMQKDIPSLAELAEYMETTPKSLRKWFRMYKKALTRRFDFKSFGDDRIRDHYDVFYGSDFYQFSKDAEVAIEKFFDDTGKRIMKDYDSGGAEETIEKSTGLDTIYNGDANIFNKTTMVMQISSTKQLWHKSVARGHFGELLCAQSKKILTVVRYLRMAKLSSSATFNEIKLGCSLSLGAHLHCVRKSSVLRRDRKSEQFAWWMGARSRRRLNAMDVAQHTTGRFLLFLMKRMLGMMGL